jgi:hypothetical protein
MLHLLNKTYKLLATRFIQHVEEATWLSLIVVVPKKNGKFIIYVDFKKLNANTQKSIFNILHMRYTCKA